MSKVREMSDVVLSILLLIISYCFWDMSKLFDTGAGATIVNCSFILVVFIYFFIKGIKINKRAAGYLLIALIASFYFMIFDNGLIEKMMVVVMFLYTVFWIAQLNDKLIDKGVGGYVFGDIKNMFVLLPFDNYGVIFVKLKSAFGNKKKNKNIVPAIAGFAIMFPVLMIVVFLLARADAGFENMVEGLFRLTEKINLKTVWKIILALFTGCYLGGLIFGSVENDNQGLADKEEKDELRNNFKTAPRAGVYSALASINFVYVLFILSQFGYLFDAMKGKLPESMTYSEYARRGFFEICIITGINMIILALAHLFIQDSEDGGEHKSDVYGMLRIQGVALCVFTALLDVTAISKMAMYISVYGLTYLRTFTSCFMIYMLYVILCVVVRQFRTYKLFRYIIVGGTVGLLVMGYANIDGVIANFNVSRYLNEMKSGKKEATIDYDCLAKLSDGSAPYLKMIYNSEYSSKADKDMALGILQGEIEDNKGFFGNSKRGYMVEKTFRTFNFATAKKIAILDKIGEQE